MLAEGRTLTSGVQTVARAVVDLLVTGLETSWNDREILAFDEAVDA
jgi:hypothetical protein